MGRNNRLKLAFVLSVVFLFGVTILAESAAWARAGGGRSMGSRGSRSYSAPRTPSSPSSPSSRTPGYTPSSPGQPSSGGAFSRSPFLQGMAGGLAGGLLGNMLFGSSGHAVSAGGPVAGGGGGGLGFLDILILGLLAFFAWKFFKRRREQRVMATGYQQEGYPAQYEAPSGYPQGGGAYSPGYGQGYESHGSQLETDELQKGLDQIHGFDPSFHEETFKETAQDLFFRIQAGWMNRDVDAIRGYLVDEMAESFRQELEAMKQKGVVNRLENIAVRKVELSEAWQETGKDYITVLITANLLDYTVDDSSGKVVEGDKLNPVKFREFWTFCRNIGTRSWQLSGIAQSDQPLVRYN